MSLHGLKDVRVPSTRTAGPPRMPGWEDHILACDCDRDCGSIDDVTLHDGQVGVSGCHRLGAADNAVTVCA